MQKKREQKNGDDYKIVISELGIRPFHMLRAAFALMGIIPLLILFYIIIGKNFLYHLFLGTNSFIAGIAIFISVMGFLYAYNLVGGMIKKLLLYSSERKRSDDEKIEVLLAVSHDLKSPLTTIQTGIRNMLDGVAGAINKGQAEIAEICLNAVRKVSGFISELLDISKINFVRTNLKRERVNFEKIIRREVNEISELAKRNNNQNVICDILTADSDIWADKSKLSRAVMNLLSNATKYTPFGGRIDARLFADEDTVTLAVINTGAGIPPDALDKIFNKYERLSEHTGIEGAGLGLSIVKDIVDLHKGHLTVKSEPGRETEFNIILPRDLRIRERMPLSV